MKKLAVALLGIMLCQSALASSKLPFVGERSFDYGQGTSSGMKVKIDKKGNVLITGRSGEWDFDRQEYYDYIAYKGKYKKVMCDDYVCFRIIDENVIAFTDKKGKISECPIPYSFLNAEIPCTFFLTKF